MSHKSKVMRQQEAQQRQRQRLPRHESMVADALAYATANSHDPNAADRLSAQRDALERAYIEAGYLTYEACGMANAAARGKPGKWVSGSFEAPVAVEPSSIDEAVAHVISMVPAVKSATAKPHPFRPAILVVMTGDVAERKLVVNMSILNVEPLSRALQVSGINVVNVNVFRKAA